MTKFITSRGSRIIAGLFAGKPSLRASPTDSAHERTSRANRRTNVEGVQVNRKIVPRLLTWLVVFALLGTFSVSAVEVATGSSPTALAAQIRALAISRKFSRFTYVAIKRSRGYVRMACGAKRQQFKALTSVTHEHWVLMKVRVGTRDVTVGLTQAGFPHGNLVCQQEHLATSPGWLPLLLSDGNLS